MKVNTCSKINRWIIGLAFLLLPVLNACKKETPETPIEQAKSGKSVFVLNEGTFNWGNASLDLINTETGTLTEDVFMTANKRPLGDVLQSLTFIDKQAWLVVNNSMKIERINPENFISTGIIQPLTSPRYLLPLENKVYVSDLYADKIHILNRQTGAITGGIKCSGWTEEMLLVNNQVWVCNVRKAKVYVIDPQADVITDSITVGDAPRSIVQDNKGQVWVLCEGKIPPGETTGSLWKIDAQSRMVLSSFTFPAKSHPSALCTNADKSSLLFLLNGLYQMPVDAANLPDKPWIEQEQRLFYGLAVNPADNTIWLSDAKDYVQKGEVIQLNPDGTIKTSWKAGVAPRAFYFY